MPNLNKNKVLIKLGYILILFFISACHKITYEKAEFFTEYDKTMSMACVQNKKWGHFEWDAPDRRLKILLNEKYKILYDELKLDEKKIIWEKSLAYIYLRFGNDLMKKFAESDFLILKITDSLNHYYKNPEIAANRTFNHCLYNLNKPEAEIKGDLKKILRKRQKN